MCQGDGCRQVQGELLQFLCVTVGPQEKGGSLVGGSGPELPGTREWGCSERSVNTFEPPRVLNVREHEAYVRRNYTPIASSVTVLGIQNLSTLQQNPSRKGRPSTHTPPATNLTRSTTFCSRVAVAMVEGSVGSAGPGGSSHSAAACRPGGRSRWHVCS